MNMSTKMEMSQVKASDESMKATVEIVDERE